MSRRRRTVAAAGLLSMGGLLVQSAVAMPPWPGEGEAELARGRWEATVPRRSDT
jgi:hypothetical protein